MHADLVGTSLSANPSTFCVHRHGVRLVDMVLVKEMDYE